MKKKLCIYLLLGLLISCDLFDKSDDSPDFVSTWVSKGYLVEDRLPENVSSLYIESKIILNKSSFEINSTYIAKGNEVAVNKMLSELAGGILPENTSKISAMIKGTLTYTETTLTTTATHVKKYLGSTELIDTNSDMGKSVIRSWSVSDSQLSLGPNFELPLKF